MAKGNKKRGNRSRARAAIRQQMADTGHSYTACMHRDEPARDDQPVKARQAKLSDLFEGMRFPLSAEPPASTVAAAAKWQMHDLAQQEIWRSAMANPLAEAAEAIAAQQEAMLRAVAYNPLAEIIQQYTAQQQMWRSAMISPFAGAVKEFNPLGDVMKHFAIGQQQAWLTA